MPHPALEKIPPKTLPLLCKKGRRRQGPREISVLSLDLYGIIITYLWILNRLKGDQMVHDKIFRKWRITFSRLFAAALAVVVLFSTSKWESIDLISTGLFLCGAVLVGVATVGRLWCSLYISGYKSKSLVVAGPYSICRNPLYFFSLLGGIGVGLATETLSIPLLILTGFALYYPHVIKREQKKLVALHGEQYQQYCRSTPCFLPSFSRLNEPEEYSVRPKLFRKNVFDALCFIWIVGILELIEGLHESHVLPVLFRLY